TTQDNRDALFVGYAGGLVTAVWVGNDDNTPLPGIAGGGIPARIWRDFTSRAIGEPTETETPADNDEDLVNAIANISVETNIGNLSIGVGPNGLNLDIAPLRPTEPAPSGPVAPPPLPATPPAQQPAEKQQ
ncbi:MAG: penicillin-binding protein, partial [Sphingobium phenoxybenzoativorans]